SGLEDERCAAGIVEELGHRHNGALAGATYPNDTTVAEQRRRPRFEDKAAGIGLHLGPIEGDEVHGARIVAAEVTHEPLADLADKAGIRAVGEEDAFIEVRLPEEALDLMRLEGGHLMSAASRVGVARCPSIASRTKSAA